MSQRVTVVANSVARKNIEPIIRLIEQSAPRSVELNIALTPGPETAAAIARNHIGNTDLFIAVGGDGTVSEVVTGLHESNLPLAIIPAGSTNIIAREHAIPTSPLKAISLAFGKHRIAKLDLAYCNERPFIHMAGMGFDSYMFDFTSPELKRKIGWAAYFPAAARALFQGPQDYHIVADGEQFECRAPLILVANGRSVLSPKVKIHPDIVSDDGYLDMLVFRANTPLALLRTISRFASLSLVKSPFVTHIRMQSAEVKSAARVPIEVDGDVVTTTPAKFTVKPRKIGLAVPVR